RPLDRHALRPWSTRCDRTLSSRAARPGEPCTDKRECRRVAPGGWTGRVRHSHKTRSLARVTPAAESVRLGLRANWQQFTLLVVINAFVGGMVGLERAVLPLLAEQDFLVT